MYACLYVNYAFLCHVPIEIKISVRRCAYGRVRFKGCGGAVKGRGGGGNVCLAVESYFTYLKQR